MEEQNKQNMTDESEIDLMEILRKIIKIRRTLYSVKCSQALYGGSNFVPRDGQFQR